MPAAQMYIGERRPISKQLWISTRSVVAEACHKDDREQFAAAAADGDDDVVDDDDEDAAAVHNDSSHYDRRSPSTSTPQEGSCHQSSYVSTR